MKNSDVNELSLNKKRKKKEKKKRLWA